jgi:hypothetical protein
MTDHVLTTVTCERLRFGCLFVMLVDRLYSNYTTPVLGLRHLYVFSDNVSGGDTTRDLSRCPPAAGESL